MATRTTVKVSGLKELGQEMQSLGKDVAGRVARAATASGAKVVQKAAKAKIVGEGLVDTGLLQKSVIVKRLRPSEAAPLTSQHIVTVKKGNKKGVNWVKGMKHPDAYYWFFHEFGTVNIPARPFMRPAFQSTKQQQVDAVVDRIKGRLNKLKKVGGK